MTMYRKNNQGPTRASLPFRGGVFMIMWSGGLKPSAVAGRPLSKQADSSVSHCETTFQQTRPDAHSVTKLTQSNCTGIKASGIPSKTVKKIETTSPIFDEIKYRINCFVLL